MRNTVLLLLSLIAMEAAAQTEMTQVMEKRAREMHKTILSSVKNDWKKFIKENYTEALIKKPMRSQKVTTDEGSSTASEPTAANIDSKAQMFAQLHEDFEGSSIASIKTEGEKVTMTVRNDQMTGVFTLWFENKSPWLIDRLGVEVEN
jgi:hypothetical protein